MRRYAPALIVAAWAATVAVGAATAQEVGETEASASLGASITKGNTDTERYNAAVDYRQRTERNRYIAGLDLNRGKSEGVEDTHNTRLFARYDRFFNGPWYLDMYTSLLQDKERDLRYRTMVGAGAGYQFFDTSELRLSIELGPGYLRQQRYDGDRESEVTARWATDYRQFFGDRAVQLFHNHEIVVPTDDSNAWMAITRTGVRTPLSQNLSASLQLNYDYDHAPPEETRRYDSVTLLNIVFEW